MQRLDDNTPARQALKEALRSVNKPQGRPKITWLKLVRNNLMDAGIQHYYSIDLVNLNDTHFHQEINELAQRLLACVYRECHVLLIRRANIIIILK